MTIDRPIFFIGIPRSGTTVSFEVFAAHEALAWRSNYIDVFPRWPRAELVRRLWDNRLIRSRGKKDQGEGLG